MIDEPNGMLPILNLDDQTSWDHVLGIANPHLTSEGLGRLRKALAESAKSIIVEHHYIDRDYRNTFSHFYSKRFVVPDSRCIRLHFFDVTVERATLFDHSERLYPHYLGYSVIRPTRPNCIGRTLLKPTSRPSARGAMCICSEKTSIQGVEFTIEGFPFISQDADVTVCAQAALWMLARYYSDRYPFYPEIYPVEIVNLTRDYSVGRLLPTSGLRVWQLAEALRRMRFSPLIYARDIYPDTFDHLLYTYIESGIPVLAALRDHVIVLFGHVSNFSGIADIGAAVPGKSFSYSSQLNNSYVGHDDNGIPYQMLDKNPISPTPEGHMAYSSANVEQFVAPLPEKVFLPAESFETIVTELLHASPMGYEVNSPRLRLETQKPETLILRIFLTSGRSFKSRIRERGMGSSLAADIYRAVPLPHFVWVCELSLKTIYPKHIVGEIIWDATRNKYEDDGWVVVHYPEVLIVNDNAALNAYPEPAYHSLGHSTDYPIYRSNLRDVP